MDCFRFMTYTVANLKTERRGIRCDRSSALGNPFVMRNESERTAVVEAFRRYLWRVLHIWDDPSQAAEIVATEMGLLIADKWKRPTQYAVASEIQRIERLSSATLLCWCHPKLCHCDVIVKYLEWWKSQEGDRND